MSNLRYFAKCEVQNGDSYCFLIVNSFHVLVLEAPCTGTEAICICEHESVSPSMLISMWDCWFRHHIDICLENPHSVKTLFPLWLSLNENSSFTQLFWLHKQ